MAWGGICLGARTKLSLSKCRWLHTKYSARACDNFSPLYRRKALLLRSNFALTFRQPILLFGTPCTF